MEDNRWTIRGVSEDARDAIEEVRQLTGIPNGRLLSDAILYWYSDLEEEDPIPAVRQAA